MTMITDQIELASQLKEKNGKKKNLLCEKWLNISCCERGYKNKTQETEELSSVSSGKVYPNDKPSHGDGPTF